MAPVPPIMAGIYICEYFCDKVKAPLLFFLVHHSGIDEIYNFVDGMDYNQTP